MIKNILKFKYSNLKNRGFSIIEALITIFAFSLAVIVIAGLFARSVYLQRRASVVQKIQENAIFIFETMAREIRVSDVLFQDNNTCTLATLNLIHPVNGNVSYSLSNGNAVRINASNVDSLNSDDVQFTRLAFCVTGSSLGDDRPSKITIIASIQSKNTTFPVPINLQTTVTSRSIVN